jgi:hypothetical protein
VAGEGILHNRSSMISLAQRLWLVTMRAQAPVRGAGGNCCIIKSRFNPSAVEFRHLREWCEQTPNPIIKIDL